MRVARYHSAPRNQVPLLTHSFEYISSRLPVAVFRVEANEGVEHNRVEFELRIEKRRVNKLSQKEVSGSDAGFEEDGVGSEVRGEAILGHKIQGGDCFFDVAGISMAD